MPAVLRNLCETLHRDVDLVVALWEREAQGGPWSLLPADDRRDPLPVVIHSLADVALCDTPRRAAAMRLVEHAATHGGRRQTQGIPDALVFKEYDLLHRALWAYFQEHEHDSVAAFAGVHRMDVAITLASRASMLGYHRAMVEDQGRWLGALHGLVNEVPLRYED